MAHTSVILNAHPAWAGGRETASINYSGWKQQWYQSYLSFEMSGVTDDVRFLASCLDGRKWHFKLAICSTGRCLMPERQAPFSVARICRGYQQG